MAFCPPWWGIIFNPFYIVRRGLYLALLRHAPMASGRLLDFGAGAAPYRHLFKVDQYVTVDIAASGHPSTNKVSDYYYDGRILPFSDDTFDFIFSTEVFEHIFNLDEILKELARILKPDGKILVTSPFVWDEHERPFDFARYTSFGMRHLLEKAGFVIEETEKSGGYLETAFQMIVVYLWYRRSLSFFRPVQKLATVFLFAPIMIAGRLLTFLLPKDDRFYLNNVLVARLASADTNAV
jgi:SAM-dependent methyltransferase